MSHLIPQSQHQLANYLRANLRGFLGRSNNIEMQVVIANKARKLQDEYTKIGIIRINSNGIKVLK